MANNYNKKNKESSRGVWLKLLNQFKPHKDYEVSNYYGVSLLKKKKGGVYSIKLVHDYISRGVFSSAYEVHDFQQAIKIIEILEWFAKDEDLRPTVHDEEIDLDALDGEESEVNLDF